ncbi:MAG: glycosyltransferase family 2 protein, partial [Clostridia bacterium]|nr:glycosyltransferase family 2 protein [Clostridia bacterium]
MFFSVIVPVYKVEEYLENCIESVRNQTFSDFELILVDDGSPDRCPGICDEYAKKDGRIKVVHKPNGGLASARRAGIKVAEGDYVFNLDSDDLIEADTLESAYKIIKDTDCEIVSFSYRWVKGGKTIKITNDCIPEGLYTGEKIEKYIYPGLLMDKDMNHLSYYLAGKAVKRELLVPNQLGVSEKISLGEDLCCVFPCYLQAKSVYISKKNAYLYTVREDSMSKGFNTKQIFLLEDVINEISKNNIEKISDFQDQLIRYSCFMFFTIL